MVNPGGPGAPGTDYAAAASRVFREPLLRAFDIVGFDPRGTGDSAPVDCLTDDQLDTYLSSDPNPDTAEEEREFARLIREFGRGCAELSGDEVNHVSTIEAARDMDVLRSALGEDTLTYFGASYNEGGFSVEMRDMEKQPGGKAAARVFRENRRTWGRLVIDSVFEKRTKGTYSSLTECALLLKRGGGPAAPRVGDVVEGWTERTRGGGSDRHTYLYYAAFLPYPNPPGGD